MSAAQKIVVSLTVLVLLGAVIFFVWPEDTMVNSPIVSDMEDPALVFFEALDPSYITCGRETHQGGLGYNETMRTCFIEAFTSCRKVKLQQELYTIEGDPIFTTAYIRGEGVRGCEIGIQIDNRDTFGAHGVRETVCRSVRVDSSTAQQSLLFDNCEDGTQPFLY